MAPAEKKWPFDFGFGLPWAASGFGTYLVQSFSSRERGTVGLWSPSPPLDRDVS